MTKSQLRRTAVTYLASGFAMALVGGLHHAWLMLFVGVLLVGVGMVTTLTASPEAYGRALGVYLSVAGAALTAAGVARLSWWSVVVGGALVGLGLLTAWGRAEMTSLLRGDMDERRHRAASHAFRVGFIVTVWWIAVAALASGVHGAATTWWTAGVVAGLAGALGDYALVLRRI